MKHRPWYKEFWAWFLLILLGSSVTLSISLVVVAVRTADSLVVTNYYDAGKGINQSLVREQHAQNLALRATLIVDNVMGTAVLTLEGNSRPELLTLNLISPTQAEKDRQIILQRIEGNHYSGNLSDAITGRRFVELLGTEGADTWRLFEEETVASGHPILLGDT